MLQEKKNTIMVEKAQISELSYGLQTARSDPAHHTPSCASLLLIPYADTFSLCYFFF